MGFTKYRVENGSVNKKDGRARKVVDEVGKRIASEQQKERDQ